MAGSKKNFFRDRLREQGVIIPEKDAVTPVAPMSPVTTIKTNTSVSLTPGKVTGLAADSKFTESKKRQSQLNNLGTLGAGLMRLSESKMGGKAEDSGLAAERDAKREKDARTYQARLQTTKNEMESGRRKAYETDSYDGKLLAEELLGMTTDRVKTNREQQYAGLTQKSWESKTASKLTAKQEATLRRYAEAGDFAAVKDYYDAISADLNKKYTEEQEVQARRLTRDSKSNGVTNAHSKAVEAGLEEVKNGSAFVSIAKESTKVGMMDSVAGIPAYVDAAVNRAIYNATGKYRPTDTYSEAYLAANVTAAAQEGLSKKIDIAVNPDRHKNLNKLAHMASSGWSSAITNMTQLAMTGGFAGASKFGEKATLALMGTGVAGREFTQNVRDGQDEGRALTNATVSGMLEYLTEAVPLHNYLDAVAAANAGKLTRSAFIKSLSAQAGSESMEEVINNVAGNLWDMTYNGKDSEFSKLVEEYEKQGLTGEGEAAGQALYKLFVLDSMEAAVTAAISSVFMFGAPAVSNVKSVTARGKEFKALGDEEIRLYFEGALETADAKSSVHKQAEKLQAKLDAGRELTNAEAGNFVIEMEQYVLSEIQKQDGARADDIVAAYTDAESGKTSLETARKRSDIFNRLAHGEKVTEKELESLNVESPVTRELYERFTGQPLSENRDVALQQLRRFGETLAQREQVLAAEDAQIETANAELDAQEARAMEAAETLAAETEIEVTAEEVQDFEVYKESYLLNKPDADKGEILKAYVAYREGKQEELQAIEQRLLTGAREVGKVEADASPDVMTYSAFRDAYRVDHPKASVAESRVAYQEYLDDNEKHEIDGRSLTRNEFIEEMMQQGMEAEDASDLYDDRIARSETKEATNGRQSVQLQNENVHRGAAEEGSRPAEEDRRGDREGAAGKSESQQRADREGEARQGDARAENAGAGSEEVKLSLVIHHRDGTNEELADAKGLTPGQAEAYLQKAKRGELEWDTYIPVRKDTPQVLIDTLAAAGELVQNRSLVMQVRKAQQAMGVNTAPVKKFGSGRRKHGLSPSDIVAIMGKLDDPSNVILQGGRELPGGTVLPDTVAVFVEYKSGGKEGLAVIEFDSSLSPGSISTEFGDTQFHTVVTMFEPDTERNGEPFDYVAWLLENPNNVELKIERRQSAGSAIGKSHPNTSSKLSSSTDIVTRTAEDVNVPFKIKDTTTRDLGIHGGKNNALTVVENPGSSHTLAAEDVIRSHGFEVVWLAGDYIRTEGGAVADGMTDFKNKKVYVRVDGQFADPVAIAYHELMHILVHDELNYTKAAAAVRGALKSEFFSELSDIYFNRVASDFRDGVKTDEEIRRQTDEELLGDLLGGYDRFGETYGACSIMQDSIRAAVDRTVGLEFGAADTVFSESGDLVAEADEAGLHLSAITYEESGRATLAGWLADAVQKGEVTQTNAEKLLSDLDAVYGVVKEQMGEHLNFGVWNTMKPVVGPDGTPIFTVIRNNGDYVLNIDFSTVCTKRQSLDAVMQRIIELGHIDELKLNGKQIVEINEIIRKHKLPVACGLCFVDSKRYGQVSSMRKFIDNYNRLVESLIPKGSDLKASHFNFGEDSRFTGESDTLSTAAAGQLDFTEIDRVIATEQEKRTDGKEPTTVIYKQAKLLKSDPTARHLLSVGDGMTGKAMDNMEAANRTLHGMFAYRAGAGSAKPFAGNRQYMNDLIVRVAGHGSTAGAKNFTPAAAFAVGGVRIQSFSDFDPALFFDYVQLFSELAAKGLPAHAYTKVPAFVRLFGMTGAKINMSLIADVVSDGVAPGLDANGDYVWHYESFPVDEAMDIRSDERYSKNCGVIVVGISDEHIRKLLADPNIDMVIPYHKSGLPHALAVRMNTSKYTDYTPVQATRDENGKKVLKKDFDWYADLQKTGDARTSAQNYLNWCAEKGYTPKFEKFAYKTVQGVNGEQIIVEDGNGSPVMDDNYYKLLEDFRMYDQNGESAPQTAVELKLPENCSDILNDALKEEEELVVRRSEEVEKIVAEIGALYNKWSRVDGAVVDLDSDGKQLSKEQQEYFKDSVIRDKAGRLLPMYHGTNAKFTVFDINKAQSGMFGKGFYFTEHTGMTRNFGRRQLEVYLNVKKPLIFGKDDVSLLGKDGYDAVINYDDRGAMSSVVVVSPEQIKLTDNTNPTADADIRFSRVAETERTSESAENFEFSRTYTRHLQPLEKGSAEQSRSHVLTLIDAEQQKQIRQQAFNAFVPAAKAETSLNTELRINDKEIREKVRSVQREIKHNNAIVRKEEQVRGLKEKLEDQKQQSKRDLKTADRKADYRVAEATRATEMSVGRQLTKEFDREKAELEREHEKQTKQELAVAKREADYRVAEATRAAEMHEGAKVAKAATRANDKIEKIKQEAEEKRRLRSYRAIDARRTAKGYRNTAAENPNNDAVDTVRKLKDEKNVLLNRAKLAQDLKSKIGSPLYRAFVNRVQPIDTLSKKQTGVKAGSLINLLHSSSSTAETIFRTALVDKEGKVIGAAMSDIMLMWTGEGKNRKVDMERQAILQDYMLHRHNVYRMGFRKAAREAVVALEQEHPWLVDLTPKELSLLVAERSENWTKRNDIAVEYNNRMNTYLQSKDKPIFADSKGRPVTAATSEAIVRDYEAQYDWLAQKAEDIYAWWDSFMTEWAVGSSVSTSAYEIMRDTYPCYVPTYRVNKGMGGAASVNGSSISPGSATKRAVGSTREVEAIEESFAKLVNKIIRLERTNELLTNLVDTAMYDSDGVLEGEIQFDWDGYYDGNGSFGETMLTGSMLNGDSSVALEDEAAKEALSKDGQYYRISAWYNGEKLSAFVSKDIFDALSSVVGHKHDRLDAITKIGNTLTGPMKTMITGINPFFAIRNMSRDLPTAMINSTAGLAFTKYYAQAWTEMLGKSEHWQQFVALGGTHNGYYGMSKTFTEKMQTRKSAAQKGLEALGTVNEYTEAVTRFAEFLATIDRYGDTYESYIQGIKNAAEVTVDFSRKGEYGGFLNAWIPYWNPAVQGIDRWVRSVFNNDEGLKGSLKTVSRGVLLAALPEALLYVVLKHLGEDRWDEWEELNDRTKHAYYCIPINDHEFIKIAKNREWAAVLGTPLMALLEKKNGRVDPLENFVEDTLMVNFVPGGVEEAIGIGTLIELKTNKDFAGRTIIPSNLKDVDKIEQWNDETSMLAYGIAKALEKTKVEISPMALDYIMHDYFGDFVSTFALDTLNMGWTTGAFEAEDIGTLTKDFAKGTFVADNRYSAQSVNDYYKVMDDLEQEYNTIAKNDPNFKESHAYKMYKALNDGWGKDISALYKERNGMKDGPEKDAVQQEIVGLAQSALSFYKEATAAGDKNPDLTVKYSGLNPVVSKELIRLNDFTVGDDKYSFLPSTGATVMEFRGKKYKIDDDKAKAKYEEIYLEVYSEFMAEVMSSGKYQRADSDEKKAKILEDTRKDVLKEAKKLMGEWMKENGYKPE